jgi:hypothetical protein
MAVRVAPDERTSPTTVGWMQQWSSLGQFAGPPLVAWVPEPGRRLAVDLAGHGSACTCSGMALWSPSPARLRPHRPAPDAACP